MAGKFSRKKQEPGASWVLGVVLIALLLAAITLGALWVLRASKAVDASDNAVSQTPAEPSGAQENTMQQPQMTESAAGPQPEPDALPARAGARTRTGVCARDADGAGRQFNPQYRLLVSRIAGWRI